MRKITILLFLVLAGAASFGQTDTANTVKREKVYKVKLAWELPSSAAAILLSSTGFRKLEKVSSMTEADILKLNPNDVNGFDRPVIFNNPARYADAQSKSDLFLNISILTPSLLMLDKKIRKDWLDLLTLYLASHTVDNALYFAGAFSVRRPRPFLYNTEVPMNERVGDNKSNSFFSGHVGFATTSTFFLVKVFTDYNQIKGWRRLLLYTAATIPPALVGFYRMESGRHFRSDVLLGFISGAASGILVPELHKIHKKHENLSFSPYYAPGGATGLSLAMKF
jgi:membrane-associated phospholipid phosphatase